MTVLTDNDYNDLRPHIEVIRKYRTTGTEVSRQPRNIMARIMLERYGEVVNLSCGGCISRMYSLMNDFLDQYEQAVKNGEWTRHY